MSKALRQAGFTLIETLVAMVIMSGAIMVLANSWSGNFARLKNSRINNTMAGLMERKMTELEVLYMTKKFDEIDESAAGDFGAKYPGYKWEMKSQPFEMPDMSGALISREGGADEMLLMIVRTVADYMKEAVKELTVTVIYKGRVGAEVKNSVTTYIVDYSKPLPIGGGGGGGAGGTPGNAPGGN